MSRMATTEDRHVYSVSELNQDVRTLLETGFPAIWLEGEISNFVAPSSGHWYFSLKDDKAQVRCAMFKNRCKNVVFSPKQGDKVLVKAKISLYEARGDYQLIIEQMDESGFGDLQRQFEALKKKLQSEGLFSPTVKQELPPTPQQVGVITSPSGAAIRDILSVLKRRFPAVPVVIYPSLVQGELAADNLASMIRKANSHNVCDVLILARGGGSLEDLWAFNEEIVARAIFESKIPIVSGVGHEIDITIADFVADKRAATPSAAAEMIVPEKNEILQQIDYQKQKLYQLIKQGLQNRQISLTHTRKRLKHPSQQLTEFAQRLDEMEMRLKNAIRRMLKTNKEGLAQNIRLLYSVNPSRQITQHLKMVQFLKTTLFQHVQQALSRSHNQLALQIKALNTLSPLATLERGYSIVSLRNNNCIIRSYKQVKTNDELDIRLHNGKLICSVKKSTAD